MYGRYSIYSIFFLYAALIRVHFFCWNRKAILPIEVDTGIADADLDATQLNDDNYTEEVFKNMCFLREKVFSDVQQNINEAQARMKKEYDKKNGKPKVQFRSHTFKH